MLYIYVLELQQNKYYVGKTSNPLFRIDSHINSKGSIWTKKYKPVNLEILIANCDDYDEDKYTKIYMDKYGIENVRGGSYVSIELDKTTIEHLKKMSINANNLCFKCGKSGHFANKCYVNISKTAKKYDDKKYDDKKYDDKKYDDKIYCYYCDIECHSASALIKHESKCSMKNDSKNISCFKCGKMGHYSTYCTSKKTIKKKCDICGGSHKEVNCMHF
jgi:cellular nucleic acid-binding protein